MVYNLIFTYQAPEIMGLDEVFVNLYDLYFKNGDMDFWAKGSVKQNIKDHAEKIRASMIGRVGKNLILMDGNHKWQSMYSIKNRFTLLFIFNPECGHCRSETPKLVEFYNSNRKNLDLEVYAISSDTSMKKMADFIKEFNTPWITVNGPRSALPEHYSKMYHSDTTPTIYILDNRKIIAKKIPVERLGEFFTKYKEIEKMKKNLPAKGG